jgi:hemerythrin-like domain-containing protein
MATDLFSDATAPSFDDPLGMLCACHGRIQRQLATLDRLQRHLPEHGCDTDARAAARGILRYFDSAAPNHHADEEQSLFPRLLKTRAREAEPLISALGREHAELASGWRRLRPMLVAIAAGARANLSPKDVAKVRGAYLDHIAKEEGELIPLAAQAFDAATLREIGREMAERRGAPYDGGRNR